MEVYAHDTDKELNEPPVFRLHIELTDVDFDKLKNLPEIKVNYELK